MTITMTSSHGCTFLTLGTVILILQMLQCAHAEEGWTLWFYDAGNCKWQRSRPVGGMFGCPEGAQAVQAMDCNCSAENWNDWIPISLVPCEEGRSRGDIQTFLPHCQRASQMSNAEIIAPVFDCYETRPCVNFTDIPCVDSPTVRAIATVCASKANMSIPAIERIRDIGQWGDLCGEEMLAIECFQNYTQCNANEAHGFLINDAHCFYAEICDVGFVKPAIQTKLNDAAFNQGMIDAIDFTLCLELANSDPNPLIQEQLAIAALSCMRNLIDNAGLTGPNNELALLVAQTLLNCAARLEDLGATSEFYDFTSGRCSMRLYGDPHVETCDDINHQTTCAAPGLQTYLDISFMTITGVNTQQWSPSLVTVLTEVTIEFKSLLSPHAVTARYKASNGNLPGDFEYQATSILDIDFVLLLHLSDNRVLLIWPHTGVIIIISNWWSSIYQFTMRASQAVMNTGTGILIEGCPPGEVLFGNRRRRDTTGISKRDEDPASSIFADCISAGVPDNSHEIDACFIDVLVSGDVTIAGATALSIDDATTAQSQDAAAIHQAGVWSNNVVEIVDGGWSDWDPWVCDVTCGNGTEVRHRNCTNPPPQHGGSDCVGDDTETQACYEGECPVRGKCQKTCRARDKNSYCDKRKGCVCKKGYNMQSGKCVRVRGKCQKTCRAYDKNSHCDKRKGCVCKKGYHMQSGKCVRGKRTSSSEE